MLAITCQDVIVRSEGRDRTYGNGLLPDIKVAETADLAETVGFGAALFEATNQQHLAEQPHQRFAIFVQRLRVFSWQSIGARLIDHSRGSLPLHSRVLSPVGTLAAHSPVLLV